MLKKLMVLALTSIVSIAYIEAYADINSPTPTATSAKVSAAPTIKLAVNDVMQMQQTKHKRLADKKAETPELDSQLSKIPAQAWLILTALLCFVMRSSRRVV